MGVQENRRYFLLQMALPETAGDYIASVATRRDVKPLRSIGLKYKFFCVLAKLLPVRTLNWLVGLIYAK